MIHGIHALMYVKDADATRKFFKEMLGWSSVDAGEGWLIFAMPPGEIAAHPSDDEDDVGSCELYLMCDDVWKTVEELKRKGVKIAKPVEDMGWGIVTAIHVPGGTQMGLYQPKHPTAHGARR